MRKNLFSFGRVDDDLPCKSTDPGASLLFIFDAPLYRWCGFLSGSTVVGLARGQKVDQPRVTPDRCSVPVGNLVRNLCFSAMGAMDKGL